MIISGITCSKLVINANLNLVSNPSRPQKDPEREVPASASRIYTLRKTELQTLEAIFDAIKVNKLTFPVFLQKVFDPSTSKHEKQLGVVPFNLFPYFGTEKGLGNDA